MDDNHQKYESEMEILMTMQQMGRTPQFSETLYDFTDLPGSSNGSKLCGYPPYYMESSQTGQEESTVSSMNTRPVKEEQYLRDPIAQKWREDSPTTPSEKRVSSVEAMREMIFRIAVMQPIEIDPEAVKPPKRRNVKISKDPQSVAARQRREKISERIRILQRLVPGGTKMDTASMLDEAVHYVKFLKTQVQSLEGGVGSRPNGIGMMSGSDSQFSQNSNPFHTSNPS